MIKLVNRTSSLGIGRDALLLGVLLLAWPGVVGASTKVPLGDLVVPPSRIPQFYPFDETKYQEARSWPEYDVTCTSAPCLSGKNPAPASWGCRVPDPAPNGSVDAGALTCALANAPDNSVIFVPNGVYEMGPFGSSAQTIKIGKSNRVLRCEDPNQTRFRIFDKRAGHNCRDEKGNFNANLCGSMSVSIATPNMFQSEVSWTSGYAAGSTQVGVSSAVPFNVGDWVMLQMDDGSESCELIDSAPRQAAIDPLHRENTFNHYAKVVAKSGATLTLDRELRMDYTASTCGAKTIRKIKPIENVGVEGCGFETSTSTPRDTFGKGTAITIGAAASSWIVGNHFERFDEDVIRFRIAMRNWFQGNRIDDVQGTQFNTEGVHVSTGAADNVIENNVFVQMSVVSKQEAGSEGNVSAYNFVRSAGAWPQQDSFFTHGRFVRESLWEGNDTDTKMLTADHWWGRNGPRITIFRNRVVGNTVHAAIVTDKEKAGSWPIATDLNWIGNHAGFYMRTAACRNGFPGCLNPTHDVDAQVINMHMEKNLYRAPMGFQIDSPDPGTNCGGGVGACPSSNPGPTPTLGTNAEGNRRPAAWQNDTIPHSLYRSSSAPTWWCQESCSWNDVHSGIGAWGDDFSSSLCKLPAQIQFEGGTCTPMAGQSSPGQPLPSSGGSTGGGSTGGSSGGASTPAAGPPAAVFHCDPAVTTSCQ